jgi:hypothetical protein
VLEEACGAAERTYLSVIGDEGEERVRTACDPANMLRLNQNINPTVQSSAVSWATDRRSEWRRTPAPVLLAAYGSG